MKFRSGLIKFLCSAVATCLMVSAIGCSCSSNSNDDSGTVDSVTYQGSELHYQSSNSELASFLNDFSHRNLRYDDYAIGSTSVGNTTGFAKNWDAMGVMWHNTSGTVLGEDKWTKIYNYLNSIDQDDLGMIYNTSNGREAASTEAGTAGIPQGWPFPYWKYSTENLTTEFNTLSAHGSMSFEFNDTRESQNKNWQAEGGSFAVNTTTCYADFSSGSLSAGESFKFYKDDLSTMLTKYGGIKIEYSPFLELALDFKATNLEGYYIIWQTKEGGDEWFSVSHNELVTTQKTYFGNYSDRCYIAMYLNENWDGKTVTALGIEFMPKAGRKLTVSGQIDYIRCNYDTRQSNATYQWILALNTYVQYSNDIDRLKALMPKARKAMLFLTHALQGETGLLDISYLYGHNGIGVTKNADGSFSVDIANGVGNGYWDIIASPEKNLEANNYFYQALIAMAQLEQILIDSNSEVTEVVSVRNRALGSAENISYSYTVDSLKNLAATVKANMQKDIKPVLQADGTYDNEGGFWSAETGRFALGINEKTGKILDYGFIYWNEEAICAGIGTDEQQKSIMQWINGDRTVTGDDSTGSDIYFYEFAPRMNTKDCTESFSFCGYKIAESLIKKYNTTWPRQVQNGGAVMWASYYDILARAKVLGADNAYTRLKEIQGWYKKVQTNTTGTGEDFYSGYYNAIELENELNGTEGLYTLQRAESNGPGVIGLDAEFIENIIFAKVPADFMLGMTSTTYNTVSFTNNMPSGLTYFQIDNMKFLNCVYSLCATKNSFIISNVKGTANKNHKIQLNFKEPSKSYSVYIGGEKSSDYTVANGIITVSVSFKDTTVEVK